MKSWKTIGPPLLALAIGAGGLAGGSREAAAQINDGTQPIPNIGQAPALPQNPAVGNPFLNPFAGQNGVNGFNQGAFDPFFGGGGFNPFMNGNGFNPFFTPNSFSPFFGGGGFGGPVFNVGPQVGSLTPVSGPPAPRWWMMGVRGPSSMPPMVRKASSTRSTRSARSARTLDE